jgi:adenosylcobinamide kinase/adenosylcobinamide-phosphate guanylyltransferase
MPRKSRKVTLILGGARSGKSSYAQQVATATGKKVLFCATAEPLDADMKDRIRHHRLSRPKSWRTLETPLSPAEQLAPMIKQYDTVVIDCITVLVANIMGQYATLKKQEMAVEAEVGSLIKLLEKRGADYLLVSNEVGLGVIPAFKSGRRYRDILGKVNRQLAASADEVYFLVAGIPVRIK